MAALTNTHTTLRVAIADYLGWGRNTEGAGTSWSTTEQARLDSIIKSALNRVYFPATGYVWSWLFAATTLTTTEPYATGTVGIVDGVVTLAGGVFPSWAAQGELAIDGGVYPVSSRDGNTQATLVDTSVDADAGTTYSLRRFAYDLPADFGGIEGPLTFAPNQSVMYLPVEVVSDVLLRRNRQNNSYTGHPKIAAIRPKTFVAATGQRWQVVLFPTPDAVYQLEYRYRLLANMLSSTDLYPLGGPDVGELVLAMCLAVAEQRYRDVKGPMTEDAELKLAAAIQQDARSFSPEFLGYNGDHSDGVRDSRFSGIAVHSYDGTVYYDRNP